MPNLIVSVGQGGIAPMSKFWELNLRELRHASKKNKGKASSRSSSSSNLSSAHSAKVVSKGGGCHPTLQALYYSRRWTAPRWVCVDSEVKVRRASAFTEMNERKSIKS